MQISNLIHPDIGRQSHYAPLQLTYAGLEAEGLKRVKPRRAVSNPIFNICNIFHAGLKNVTFLSSPI